MGKLIFPWGQIKTVDAMSRGLEKRRLGTSGLETTFLGFGSLEIGRDWGLGDDSVTRRQLLRFFLRWDYKVD